VSYKFIRQSEIGQSRIQSFAFVISVCGCALLSLGFAASSFVAVRQPSVIGLDEKINPNKAQIASLVRLPGIGVSRAEAIVAYRSNFSNTESGKVVFCSSDDLQKVKGIGPKTAQNISQWLKFE
jgi:competence protein ComEA